jgi:DNA-binding CsgD family transcriptional regulator/tetratricopeptide (TPR) repeat protein
MLLERNEHWAILRECFSGARAGKGRVVVVAGEAGAGKSSLVDAFTAGQDRSIPILHARCDALTTAPPLGPLFEIAPVAGPALSRALRSDMPRHNIFSTFLSLISANPCVVIFEDVHWADQATLDLCRFLGRRIAPTCALLILVYRDDEIDRAHPLHTVLCDLPRETTRLQVNPLSRQAVAKLARAARRRIPGLFERTGGNPLLVTEILAAPGAGIPHGVLDRTCARMQALSPSARLAAELTSVVPGRIDVRILEAALDSAFAAIDECTMYGLLQIENGTAAFRHELVREALYASLPPRHRQSLHGRVLDAMLASGRVPPVNLLHQAVLAQRNDIVLTFAPRAAAEAAFRGAHREAVRLYTDALQCAAEQPPGELIALLDPLARQCIFIGDTERALALRRRQLTLVREFGSAEQAVQVMCAISRLEWFMGRRPESELDADQALALASALPVSTATAWAYANRAQLHMFASETDGACKCGERALQMADQIGAQDIRVQVLNTIGTACHIRGDRDGASLLEESLATALAEQFEEHAVRAWSNLAWTSIRSRDLDGARRAIDAGLEYSGERDLPMANAFLMGWRAQVHMLRGDWPSAQTDAESVASRKEFPLQIRLPAMLSRACVHIRCGAACAKGLLEDIDARTMSIGESMRRLPLALLFAEYAFLADEPELAGRAQEIAAPWSNLKSEESSLVALNYWLSRINPAEPLPDSTDNPWSMMRRGDIDAAAEAFKRLDRPYEVALALSNGSVHQRLAALTEFDRLGALPAARKLRQALRRAGVRSLPRGPRSSTRSNPAGLTRRELEVLHLLSEDLSDSLIARRLHVSVRTIGHHVSAILAKLSTPSRRKAVEAARSSGFIALPTRSAIKETRATAS